MKPRLLLSCAAWLLVFPAAGYGQFSDDNWWKTGGSITVPTPTGSPVSNYGRSDRVEREPVSPEERARRQEERRQREQWEVDRKHRKQIDQKVKQAAPELSRIAQQSFARVPSAAVAHTVEPNRTGPFLIRSDDRKASLLSPLQGIRIPPSNIPAENLRRAAAIARTIRQPASGQTLSEEDQYELAAEMVKAMNGDALSVDLVDYGRGNEKDMRQVAEQASVGAQLEQRYAEARADRLRWEKRLVEIAQLQKSGGSLDAAQVRERDQALERYRTAHQSESRLKEETKAAAERIVIIMEGSTSRSSERKHP